MFIFILNRKYVSSGRIKGGSFAVYYKGQWLVDLWGGYADEQSKAPWKNDTITILHSMDDYDKPVSHYWPNFAKNGKENITVKILLSHQIWCFKIYHRMKRTEYCT
ncbi:LOW QUALITY PROTEIN: hypothetical protein KUTeg_006837 [Tegillarca granosa]|uniref:Beta-lactamase-related domain-containing protein n=1 Tax=Tegillarca granosa TaxID=220873 RepID=A0ABQ9FDV9_TEGGR|nr:LOW QUALITY PROTEIN: hypothetical protein KUTeg_006837 [Tegillarca granosa]